MNRKTALKRTARFAKDHKLKKSTIMVLFAVIILSCYLKDFIFKLTGYLFAPLRFVCVMIGGFFKRIFSPLYSFCRKNRADILKFECTFLAVSFILLYMFNKNYLQSVWGDETGVSALEPWDNYPVEENTINIDAVTWNTSNEDNREDETDKIINNEKNDDNNIEDKLPKVLLNQPLYCISLNRLLNTVTIYTYDETGNYNVPVKAMRCSTGGENTPLGTFTLSDKFKFATLQFSSYGQYCTRITGAILFHSSTYTERKKDTLSAEDYNKLGESVSHGCVRLTTADAKWIYDNCGEGTVVTIYDGEDEGPLGKPETIKVPEGTLWDPTDPDPENPWNDKLPVISGASNKVVYEYDDYTVMKGITAVDTCGNDITDHIVVEGEVDVNIPGVYTVTYKVKDVLGRGDEITVEITIK